MISERCIGSTNCPSACGRRCASNRTRRPKPRAVRSASGGGTGCQLGCGLWARNKRLPAWNMIGTISSPSTTSHKSMVQCAPEPDRVHLRRRMEQAKGGGRRGQAGDPAGLELAWHQRSQPAHTAAGRLPVPGRPAPSRRRPCCRWRAGGRGLSANPVCERSPRPGDLPDVRQQFQPDGRARFCKPGCRQKAYRLRHRRLDTAALTDFTHQLHCEHLLLEQAVYECSSGQERLVDERRRRSCNLWCRNRDRW